MLTYDEAYNIIVVAHLMGEMEGKQEISTNLDDYEPRAIIVKEIVDDWLDQKDIQSRGEKGYVAEYAVRKLHERFQHSREDDA